MITAKVIAIAPAQHGSDAKVFARAQTLVSSENPKGEVMFYANPPFWTGGCSPYVGQAVTIGHIDRKTSPHWSQPKWLARDVSSAKSVEHYAPKRLREPTTLAQPASSLLGRILAALGIRSLSVSKLN